MARTRRFTAEYFEIVAELHRHARNLGGRLEEAQKHIVLQAAYYSAHTKSEVNEFGAGFEPRIALGLVVWALGIAKIQEIKILAPYLESDDEELRSVVLGRISNDAGQSDQPEPNEVVRALLMYLDAPGVRIRRDDSSPTVVRILYQSAPTATFHHFVRRSFQGKGVREKSRELYWADHVIHDVIWKKTFQFLKPGEIELAVAQLEKLSQVEEWWAKLYVVEMMRRYKEFRDEKILERLRKDPNPLVSKAANEPFPREEGEEGGIFNLLR